MIDTRTVQRALAQMGFYAGAIDGAAGPKTRAGIRNALIAHGVIGVSLWPDERCRVGIEQVVMKNAGIDTGEIDGFIGPDTRLAQERWQDLQRRLPTSDMHRVSPWPHQSAVRSFYGNPGENLVRIALPYPMRLDWDRTTTIRSTTVHAKVADSVQRCLKAELDHFGGHIAELGLDLWGGCYANRPMRGGTATSMHAWGIALDRNPSANPLRADHRTAAFARPEYRVLHRIWEDEGWINLGRERDFDWMHFQAARL